MNFEALRRVEEVAETQQVPSLALRDWRYSVRWRGGLDVSRNGGYRHLRRRVKQCFLEGFFALAPLANSGILLGRHRAERRNG